MKFEYIRGHLFIQIFRNNTGDRPVTPQKFPKNYYFAQ